jgi:hypothetical protein
MISEDYAVPGVKPTLLFRISSQASITTRFASCFNTAERWSEDVSEDVASELRRRCDLELRDLSGSATDFVERHEGAVWRQLTLRLSLIGSHFRRRYRRKKRPASCPRAWKSWTRVFGIGAVVLWPGRGRWSE